MRSRPVRETFRSYNCYLITSFYGIPPEPADTVGEQYKYRTSFNLINESGGGPRAVNAVNHIKWHRVSSPMSLAGSIPFVGYFRWRDVLDLDPRAFFEPITRNLLANQVPDWDRAVFNAIPSLRSEFNLINFVLEADEIPRMIGSLWQLFRNLPNHLRFLTPRDLAERNLEVSFGVLPLISDIEAIYDRMSNFGQQLANIRDALRRGVRASYGDDDTFNVQLPYSLKGTHSGFDYEGTLTLSGTTKVTVSCRVSGSLNVQPWQLYLDYVGLYPDLGTLWNALPFSFLIDYIVPIGQALEGEAWSTPAYNLSKGCVSLRVVGEWTFRPTKVFRSGKQLDLDQQSLANISSGFVTGSYIQYIRIPSVPVLDGVDLPRLRVPRARQLLNTVSLAATARSRR